MNPTSIVSLRDRSRLLVALACGIAVSVMYSSCNNPSSPARTDQRESRIENVIAEYSDIIEAFPNHPQSEFLLGLLADAAEIDGIVPKGSDARDALIKRFPDHNLGLFVVSKRIEELAAQGPQAQRDYCLRMESEYPNTAVSVMAFDKWITLLEANSPMEFLDRCDRQIGAGGTEKKRRIALLRRAQHYQSVGDSLFASADFLQFWTLFPKQVQSLGLSETITTCLRSTGLLAEAESLRITNEPAVVSRLFGESLNSVVHAKSAEEIDSPDLRLAWHYFHGTPDMESVLHGPDFSRSSILAQSEWTVRHACRLANDGRKEEAFALAQRQLDNERLILDEARSGESQKFARLAVLQMALPRFLLRLFMDTSQSSEATNIYYLNKSRSAALTVSKLSQLSIQMVMALTHADPSSQALAYSITEESIRIFLVVDDRKAALDAYERILAEFPQSEFAPQYLVRMAEFLEKSLESPIKSADVLARIRTEYPDSPLVEKAWVKQGLLLYQAERPEGAIDVLQDFLVERPGSPETPVAKLVIALSEAALGSDAQAENDMLQLVEEHRESPVAPRALFWLASQAIARQDYGHAKRLLQDVMERYPASDEAKKASELEHRLAELPSGEGTAQ